MPRVCLEPLACNRLLEFDGRVAHVGRVPLMGGRRMCATVSSSAKAEVCSTRQRSLAGDMHCVDDGWNLVMELNGLNSNSILRRYTWGLDLTGQSGNPSVGGIHGAGGIGGLLAMRSGSGTATTSDDGSYLYFYNANGRVARVGLSTWGLDSECR